MVKGANPRFVVTNLHTPPQKLYDDFYVQRGCASEHPIKELKPLNFPIKEPKAFP